MHKSCIYIQKSIYLAPYEVRACCQRFFINGEMKGDVSLVSSKNGLDIGYIDIINAKEQLIKDINNGADDRCDGCFLLQEKEWDAIQDEKINIISIENHSLCNMKCSYCSDTYYGGVEPQYSLDYLFTGLTSVGDDLHIAWGGGEPTARKDFDRLFADLNNRFHPKTQRVFTNALKHSSVLQSALDSRMTSITTSIDSGTESTFQQVRGSKGLDKVLRSLERYSANSPDLVTIKYIFTEDNYDTYNLAQFVLNLRKHNLGQCNYLISADFNYEALEDRIVFSIISLYFMLLSEGIYAVSFDDHIFHKVRKIGKNVNLYIDSLEEKSTQICMVQDSIKSFMDREGEVIIWGTGEFAKYLLNTAQSDGFTVLGVVDGMADKWGDEFMGFEVQSPDFLIGRESDIVIASVNFYGEIFNAILSLGIPKERVIPNFLL